MKITKLLFTAAAAGTAYAALNYLRRTPLDLRAKVVFITGGSRGLGLAIAREFGARGAIVAICARNREELERADADLRGRNIASHFFVCDVTKADQVRATVAEVEKQAGPIDILVNNAGIIKVGPFSEMQMADFDDAMNVMFWGPLHVTFAVLPGMRERRRGSVVNITSIGGKVSVPHLLPYCCAKFAAVALSEGLRAELAPEGIRVTTIAPGLLRTGSHMNARFVGNQAAEYAWFASGAATPLVSISAERAARSVVLATVYGTGEKILSVPADILARAYGLYPELAGDVMSLVNRLLPTAEGGSGAARTGGDIERAFRSNIWKTLTSLGTAAAESLNEVRPVINNLR